LPQIRVSDETYKRLVPLRTGLDTFNDVIARLLFSRQRYHDLLKELEGAGTFVEADRAKDS